MEWVPDGVINSIVHHNMLLPAPWEISVPSLGWCYAPGHLAHIFLSFLVCYVLIWSHDIDSHDRLPVQQSRFTGNSIVPSVWFILYCSLLMVVCDHHCSWLHCSVTAIVCDSIVPLICTLSQVAALLYISWTYILELGLKPDLVCNLLRSLSLLLEQIISFFNFFGIIFKSLKIFPIPLYHHPDIGLNDLLIFITFQSTLSY